MIKCTVHKLSPSKILYLEDSNKKIVATTIRDTQYLLIKRKKLCYLYLI
jgi:hypothetical protein